MVCEGKSGKVQIIITLYEPQDRQRQPRYNLTPNVPSNKCMEQQTGAQITNTPRQTDRQTDTFGFI